MRFRKIFWPKYLSGLIVLTFLKAYEPIRIQKCGIMNKNRLVFNQKTRVKKSDFFKKISWEAQK